MLLHRGLRWWTGGERHPLLGPGERRRLRSAVECGLRVDRERVADDHAEAFDRSSQPELTLLDLVQTFEDLVPEVCRGQSRGPSEIIVGPRSFRLATLHRHARTLHFRPIDRSLVALLIAGACARSVTGSVCEA